MSTVEQAPQLRELKEADRKSVLEKISRSKAARIGAVGLSALGLAAGAFEGGKSILHSVPERPATPIEQIQNDPTGYQAELHQYNGNNPNVLIEYVKSLPNGEKPYALVTNKETGKQVRVNLTSASELAQDFGISGEQLTGTGLAVRDMFMRERPDFAKGVETPALQTVGGDVSHSLAEGYSREYYTGDSHHAPNDVRYQKEQWRAGTAGSSVEVVIPAQTNETGVEG